jgi:CubicO group peptidase (beta-lactamase class C family)
MSDKPSAEQRAEIDAIFAEWDREDSPGCALGVVIDGKLAWARGYGMSNLEHDIPITPASIFHIASISKQFTAFSILLLAEEGLLSLDDDIRQYVPEIPDYGHKITIRHFIHHTSGIRDMWDLLWLSGWREDDLINEDDLLDILPRQTRLNFAPGEEHLYSNSGYALLSVIVKRVSGKSLPEFVDERVFKPLGMTRSHIHNDHTRIVKGRTQAYYKRKGGGFRISIPVFDVDGTTSLFTTVEDLARWEANYRTRQIGSPEIHEQMVTVGALNAEGPMNYAFGLTRRNYRGVELIEHSGADAGYRAHFMRVPEHEMAIFCLCNQGEMLPGRYCEQVLDVLLADTLEPAPWDTPGEVENLEQWAGIYRNRQTGELLRFVNGESGLEVGFRTMQKLVPVGTNQVIVEGQPFNGFTLSIMEGQPEVRRGLSYSPVISAPFDLVTPVSPTPARMLEYAGNYTSDEVLSGFEVDIDGENLVLKRRRHDPLTLIPAGPDCFANDRLRAEFLRDGQGTVTGFNLSTMRVRGVSFVRG